MSVELVDSIAGVVLAHGVVDSARLVVRVGEGLPPLAGRYEVVDRSVRFTPRYPVEGVAALLVMVDSQRWTLPLAKQPDPVRSTRIVAIHPSSPVLPANQLRWYLEFSAPMREGEALKHVTLRDERGAVVNKAFLEVDEELWDPTRTRVTLFFDMGRVKQGIQSRADLGPVLIPGRRYSLTIDSTWLDARGAMIVNDTVHRFATTAERHVALDPDQWRIRKATSGTRAPLEIEFGVPMDHALAERMIVIASSDGEAVGGTVSLRDHDRRLEFIPTQPWKSGQYQLRVHPSLEDVAGNRVGHAFDAAVDRGQSAGVGDRITIVSIP